MLNPSASPVEMLVGLYRNRRLVGTLAIREVIGRYRGSMIGVLWSFVHPVLMLTMFTFVFGTVLKTRWGPEVGTGGDFALVLFAGMLVFNFFSECVNQAPTLVTSNVNYVKKVVFPLDTLIWVSLAAALFHMGVGLCIWLAFFVALKGWPQMTVLLLPLAVLPIVLLAAGTSWLLASLGVFLRDVRHVTGVATTAMMFLSPLFYPMEAFPPEYRPYIMLNPATLAIEHVRDVLLWNRVPAPASYLAYLCASLPIAWLGFAWFQKTRKAFSDVL
jgi:lipopolysaccharide transport system permease protein